MVLGFHILILIYGITVRIRTHNTVFDGFGGYDYNKGMHMIGRERIMMVMVLLVAAILRLYGLNNVSPPGLEHDEVANWLIDQNILAGEHAVYFTAAYGHEAGFHYVQSGFVALLGDHALALRLPAAFAGLLLVAVTYRLNCLLFGRRIALIVAALTAVLLWPVFYSRLGLRAILLPLLSGLSAYFWWRGWQCERAASYRWWAMAGLLAGLSLHTYMAARVVPIFYVLWLVYLTVFERTKLRQQWLGIALFWLVYLLVAAPLVSYLWQNPEAEYRITEVDAPLRALQAGDWQPVLVNSVKIAGMFGFRGDMLWRQNVAGRPVFEPLAALLFYIGVGVCLAGIRNSRSAFVFFWLSTAIIPSVVTIDAPSSIRIINILPFLATPIAIVIHNSPNLSTVFPQLSTKLMYSALFFLYFFYIGWTWQALFFIWPQQEEVQFVWQSALTEVAAFLDKQEEETAVAIIGWTPTTMDPPTMALSLYRQDLIVRYVGTVHTPVTTLLLPASGTGKAQIFRPTILPLHPLLAEKLPPGQTIAASSFTLYELDTTSQPLPPLQQTATFDNEFFLRGYESLSTSDSNYLLTYWQVINPASGPRQIFLHGLDEMGQLVTQYDRLDGDASTWQKGGPCYTST